MARMCIAVYFGLPQCVGPCKDPRDCNGKSEIAMTGQSKHLVSNLEYEIQRLEKENWALKQALGYSIPADKETVMNPFQCGMCQAKNVEINQLERKLSDLEDYLGNLVLVH